MQILDFRFSQTENTLTALWRRTDPLACSEHSQSALGANTKRNVNSSQSKPSRRRTKSCTIFQNNGTKSKFRKGQNESSECCSELSRAQRVRVHLLEVTPVLD